MKVANRNGLGHGPVLILMMCGVMLLACTQSSIAQNPKLSKPDASSRIDRFLSVVEQARTLAEVSKAFGAARFTKAEEARITKELGNNSYRAKLQRLAEDEKAVASRELERVGQEKYRQKEQASFSGREIQLRELNQRAEMMFKRIQSQGVASGTYPKRAPGPSAPRTPGPPAAAAGLSGVENMARIISLSPQPITPGGGRDLFIMVENIGRVRGRVSLAIGTSSVPLTVVNWGDSAIIVRLNQDLIEIARSEIPESVRGLEIEGRVSVIAQRNTATAAVRLYIPPDRTRLRPQITVLSSHEITPSQELCLSGSNFLDERRRVSFILGSSRFAGQISKWFDGVITVVVPEIRGFPAQDAVVEVENALDLAATFPVRFRPTERTAALSEMKSALMGFDNILGADYSFTYHDFILQNGWTVVEYWMEVKSATASYRTRPRIGGNHPRAVLDVHQPAFNNVIVTHFVVIKGPLGVPFR